LSAFGRGLADNHGILGAIGDANAVESKYQAACMLYDQLVKCGSEPGLAATLVMNQQALMPLIAEKLSKCSEGVRN
jgi:hypothetical protein